ncbi:MAG: disulfide bond formation protein B [Burkholderiaceae bacterium]|nr:disulfide bond formation protein B [Burkholderiaceae bacterium]
MKSRPIVVLNAIAILCVTAVVIALISQHAFDMRPCAWCVFQRLIFLLIAVVCWLTAMTGRHWPTAIRIGGILVTLLGVGGIAAAWYQYSVASVLFSCDQTFADRFMTGSGLDAGLPWIFGIFATCMDAKVDLLGLEYALWSMGLFIVVAVAGGALALSKKST